MNKAIFVKDVSEKYRGNAKLYKLDPPFKYNKDWDINEYDSETEYVIASAADVPFSGVETYIFPSDSGGCVTDWGELEGSMRGVYDCDAAIENMGYEII